MVCKVEQSYDGIRLILNMVMSYWSNSSLVTIGGGGADEKEAPRENSQSLPWPSLMPKLCSFRSSCYAPGSLLMLGQSLISYGYGRRGSS